MSLIKARPVDTLQRIVSSFRQFEKKLDQLQDDVTVHGHTLTELRTMIGKLSNANNNTDQKTKDSKRHSNKISPMQADDNTNESKTERKNTVQYLSTKVTKKNFQSQKYVMKPSKEPFRMSASPNVRGYKATSRQRKAAAPRKATTLRPKESKKSHKKSPRKPISSSA